MRFSFPTRLLIVLTFGVATAGCTTKAEVSATTTPTEVEAKAAEPVLSMQENGTGKVVSAFAKESRLSKTVLLDQGELWLMTNEQSDASVLVTTKTDAVPKSPTGWKSTLLNNDVTWNADRCSTLFPISSAPLSSAKARILWFETQARPSAGGSTKPGPSWYQLVSLAADRRKGFEYLTPLPATDQAFPRTLHATETGVVSYLFLRPTNGSTTTADQPGSVLRQEQALFLRTLNVGANTFQDTEVPLPPGAVMRSASFEGGRLVVDLPPLGLFSVRPPEKGGVPSVLPITPASSPGLRALFAPDEVAKPVLTATQTGGELTISSKDSDTTLEIKGSGCVFGV